MDLASNSKWSLTPGIPTYAEARAFLKVINGVPYSLANSMREKIWEQVGTPQKKILIGLILMIGFRSDWKVKRENLQLKYGMKPKE